MPLMMGIFLAAFLVFALAAAAMAIGVIVKNRPLSGSCGGVARDGTEIGDCLCAREGKNVCDTEEGEKQAAAATSAAEEPVHS